MEHGQVAGLTGEKVIQEEGKKVGTSGGRDEK